MCAAGSLIPDAIQEEYYQIALPILESFPKYRPPVDLFEFKENIARLQPYSKKGARLTNEQVEAVHNLCESGNLFVSRADHPIYSKHIIKQLDLVLVDQNLKQGEIADVFMQALALRVNEFAEQPVMPVFEQLYQDVMVFTEFLQQDRHRAKLFMRRLNRDHSLATHSVNTLVIGTWLFFASRTEYRRRDLDKAALALLLHDIGMCKVPAFILAKTTPLKVEEKDKLTPHPLIGAKIMHKLGFAFDEMKQATLEHHERLDGSGYPQKTKGEAISRFGRLVAVADSFSAMVCSRPYAPGMEPAEAARKLAEDKRRYDERYTMLLNHAYLTDAFRTAQSSQAQTAQQEKAPAAS
ncbi:HD domain-containing protein [Desulfovibrio subterraneus]|uniref:HD-GYP domain-containing protein n=1 Tax=Desulfovibrio subterraneus TaxID=2718620 RepID=UPI0022B92778|nr:HD domain-containing phosphohydrolase [Desulfovibrio subterraneus]WBF67164.1 HD domain-containing protein [Desulfovibrio subterraneus]